MKEEKKLRILLTKILYIALAIVIIGTADFYFPANMYAQEIQNKNLAELLSKTLSLQECIDIALSYHPTLIAAKESVNALEAKVPQSESSYYPKLSAETSSSRTKSPPVKDSYKVGTSLSQKIYDFGKTKANVDQAKANVNVSEEDLTKAKNDIVLNVKQSYYTLLQDQRLAKVNEAALSRAELNLKYARGFYEVGTKPKSDMIKAEVEVANARVNVIKSNNSLKISQVSLKNALGVDIDFPVKIEDTLIFEKVIFDIHELMTRALDSRAELRQIKAKLQSNQASLRLAKTGYLPDFTGSASLGYSGNEFPIDNVWSIGLTFTWTIFEGWLTPWKIKEAQANIRSLEASREALKQNVTLEVEQAYLSIQEASERIEATAKSVELAKENLRLAQGRYEAGVGTILELTDAQLSLTNAETTHIQALYDYRVAIAKLEKAIGKI